MSIGRTNTSAARNNEREQPYMVEMHVPMEGFPHSMRTAMDAFHRAHKIRVRFGRRIRRDGNEHCRWCFADPFVADLFHRQFGGERLTSGGEEAAERQGRHRAAALSTTGR